MTTATTPTVDEVEKLAARLASNLCDAVPDGHAIMFNGADPAVPTLTHGDLRAAVEIVRALAEGMRREAVAPMAWHPDPKERLCRHADIIVEALNDYDGFMADDDYQPWPALHRIMGRMRERFELTGPGHATPAPAPSYAEGRRDGAKEGPAITICPRCGATPAARIVTAQRAKLAEIMETK